MKHSASWFLCFACSLIVWAHPVAQSPTCEPQSAWGDLFSLGTAGLSSSPALAVLPDRLAVAYSLSDNDGAHQVIRWLMNGSLNDPLTLTLPPIQPRGQLVFPAEQNRVFLLWIDLDEATSLPALFFALIEPTGEIARGPLRLSTEYERVYDFHAALTADNALWVTWSGAIRREANVSLRRIDGDGRPATTPIALATDARHPVLIPNTDGTLTLLYEDGRGESLIRARIAQGVLLESTRITGQISRTPGTVTNSVFAAADETHEYIFWNLTRDDGRRETWFSVGSRESTSYAAPILFEPPYQWVRPLPNARGDVRAAVMDGDTIGVVTLRAGAFGGFEPVVTCASVIDPPALYRDSGGRLILAWSQPNQSAPADLWMTIQPEN